MNINIDTNVTSAKSLDELTKLLSAIFEKLRDELQQQPGFIVVTSDEQKIPTNTAANTVIFKFDETAVVKTGYYDGEDIVLPP